MRAVLVGWDTLDAPTYRHLKFPAYQSGRQFDDTLIEQLGALPELVAACGFANAKAAGYEADDFLAAAVAAEERRGGTVLVASGDRDTFQLASESTTILYPLRAGEMARIGRRYGSLEEVLAAGPFATQADMLRLYRSIATMDAAAPLPPLADQVPNWARASALARAWELTRLADRLAEMGARAGRK